MDHFGSPNCPDFSFMRMRGAATASTISSNSTASFQVLALQEELSDVKERNIHLTARLADRDLSDNFIVIIHSFILFSPLKFATT